MLTETEAREKWCPHVRYVDSQNATGNRCYTVEHGPIKNPSSCRCIASDCMAWRWQEKKYDGASSQTIEAPVGFCGLAGRP